MHQSTICILSPYGPISGQHCVAFPTPNEAKLESRLVHGLGGTQTPSLSIHEKCKMILSCAMIMMQIIKNDVTSLPWQLVATLTKCIRKWIDSADAFVNALEDAAGPQSAMHLR